MSDTANASALISYLSVLIGRAILVSDPPIARPFSSVMPTVSRWLIKTALLYLALGLGVGVVRAGQGAGWLPGSAAALWLPQLHFLTVGWITQLIFGVAYWLFPQSREDDWGRPIMWTAYATLNLGLLLRLLSEPTLLPRDVRSWGVVTSAGLQWGASLLLVGYFWRRVRTK